MSADLTTSMLSVNDLAAHFDTAPGYLAAASNGILPRVALEAMVADLQRCAHGEVSPADYDPVVAQARAAYAAVVGVPASQVATGAVTSALVSNVAAGLPAGAQVLVGQTEFTSLVLPFAADARLNVQTVPLDELATAINSDTALVAFSLVQSATGAVIDADPIRAAAARHGALTLVDLTQAAGVLPVRADDFDLTVCHTYKWLCSPRGVAFLTATPQAAARLVPVCGGWYSADDPWHNTYWPEVAECGSMRRFDTAPAWQAFVGARESLGLFARADIDAIWKHSCELADQLCRELGLPEQHRAVVSWPDPDHRQLARLTAAGLRASGPMDLVRIAFHVWNTGDDVDAAVAALR